MPLTGIGMGLYSGKGLPFFWTTLPGFEKANGKLAGQVCMIIDSGFLSMLQPIFFYQTYNHIL
jgi:hypothetical protein